MIHEGNTETLDTQSIESLRLILGREQSRQIAYKEAQEVGESLVAFFEALAEDKIDPEQKIGARLGQDEQGI